MKTKFLLANAMAACALFTSLHANEAAILPVTTAEESSWGYHLILDCKGCDVDKITDGEYLANFVKVLVKTIDMKAYGEPLLEYFAEHNPEAAGYSLLQFIETSSITGHFVTKNGDAYLDIFSCRSFKPEDAIKTVQEQLNPQNIKSQFLLRKA